MTWECKEHGEKYDCDCAACDLAEMLNQDEYCDADFSKVEWVKK